MESKRFPLCYLDEPVSEQRIILENPYVVDMKGGEVITPECLVMENGCITHLGSRVDNGTRCIDAEGKFVIPGLWDMHVHVISSAEYAFPQFLAHGVTGIRDMGSDLTNIMEWKFYQNPGPRISFAGPILDGFMPFPAFRLFVETAQDVQIQISSTIKAGADLVKIHNMLPREAFFAAADRCRKEGIPLCGHVPFSVSASEAVQAGQKTIEHMLGIPITVSKEEELLRKRLQELKYGSPESLELNYQAWQTRDEEKFQQLVDACKAAGVYVTPTLIAMRSMCATQWDADNPLLEKYPNHVRRSIQEHNSFSTEDPQINYLIASAQKYIECSKEIVCALHKAGVPLLAGTDSAFIAGGQETMVLFGEGIHEELELLVESCLSPFEALKTATINAAECLGLGNCLGSIEPGKLADLVILSSNPLENISNIRNIEAVVLGGKYFSQEELNTL